MLRADGDALVGADFGLGAEAPDVGPPRTVGRRAQDGAFLFECEVPGGLRSGAELAVAFLGVVMEAQFFQQEIGRGKRGDVLGGKERWEPFLPKVMGALDLAFGLGSGGIAERDFVEAQGCAELGKGFGLVGEKEGMIVDVEGQGEAMGAESGGEKVEMGGKIFALIKSGARDQAAVVIEDLQERRLARLAVKPMVRGGVVLPELADLLDLPTAHRARRLFPRSAGRAALTQSPAADRGAIEREAVAAQNFGGGEAVRAGRNSLEEFAQGGEDKSAERLAVIAARSSGAPVGRAAAGAGGQVGAEEFVEAGAAQTEFSASGGAREFSGAEATQDIAHERSGMATVELLIIFIPANCPRRGRERNLKSASASLRLTSNCARIHRVHL